MQKALKYLAGFLFRKKIKQIEGRAAARQNPNAGASDTAGYDAESLAGEMMMNYINMLNQTMKNSDEES